MPRLRAHNIALLAVLLSAPLAPSSAQQPVRTTTFASMLSQTAAYTTHYQGKRVVVSIADRDLDGRLVMRNRRNVYFVLNKTTAKFIFMKWPK